MRTIMTIEQDPAAARLQLRQSLLQKRAQTTPIERRNASAAVAALLAPVLAEARTIAVYAAVRGELDLTPLLHALDGKILAWPRSHGDGHMTFHRADLHDLTPGRYGIPEPSDGPILEPHLLDAILVPGAAFAHDGGRLGMGGGYYDRYLCGVRHDALRIGVGYHWQILHSLPLLPHDLLMTHLVTDHELIRCTPHSVVSGSFPE